MNFIKMIEEMIINKQYDIINDTVLGSIFDLQTDTEYLFGIKKVANNKWNMSVSYAETESDNDNQEFFGVVGPLDYYNMLFHYNIYINEKTKTGYILPIDRNEEYQLDKKISRKRIFTEDFKRVALDFANDLKNEREYLDYLLYNLAHLNIESLENFVKFDEDAKRVVILTQ